MRKISKNKLPDDWEILRLGGEEHFAINMGQSPPSSSYNSEKDGLPFYQGNADFGTKYPMPSVYCSGPRKIAEKGDVLISVRAPVGAVNMANEKCCLGRGLSAIRSKKGDGWYLYYLLNNIRNHWPSEKTTFEGIKKAHIENMKVLWPPKNERKNIVYSLQVLDSAIEKSDVVIRKTEKIKQGLLHTLLKKGIGHKNYKQTKIGEIPENWKVVELRDIGTVATGKTPSTTKKSYWGGEIPFVCPGDMNKVRDVGKTERYVTKEGAQQATMIPPQSVLVVCIGSTIGKTAIAEKECITNQQINSILCNEKIDPAYVYYAVSAQEKVMKNYSGVAAVPIMKKSLFERLKLGLPTYDEQKEIGGILSNVDKKIETELIRKNKLTRIKQGLMNDLLTGKKRIKVE